MKRLLRNYGFSAIVPTILAKLFTFVRRSQWYVEFKEEAFDQRFGVETARQVAVQDLDINEDQRIQAVEYSPTPGSALGLILDELDVHYQEFTFVDFGCGKGRALIMAAMFPFTQIIGVEISGSLVQAARSNVARYTTRHRKCRNIDVAQLSATEYDFPKTPLVVYFYNPFGAGVLSEVLAQLRVSWIAQPRRVIVIYCNPVHRELFDRSEYWRESPLRDGGAPRGWAVYQMV